MFDYHRFVDGLMKRCPEAQCPMCKAAFDLDKDGDMNVIVKNFLVMTPLVRQEGSNLIPESKGPVAAIVECRKCGYVMFFDPGLAYWP